MLRLPAGNLRNHIGKTVSPRRGCGRNGAGTLFAPLGSVGEIGMNLALWDRRRAEAQWIAVTSACRSRGDDAARHRPDLRTSRSDCGAAQSRQGTCHACA